MIKINVLLNNSRWKDRLKNPQIYLEKKVKRLNLNNGLYKKKNIFFTLLLSGNNEIKKLNKRFRRKNKTTDVLSFPFYNKNDLKKKLKNEKEIYIGDVIINFNKVKFDKSNKDFELEFNKLWIHGLVHLFGYDHKKDKDFNNMMRVEKKFLSYLY